MASTRGRWASPDRTMVWTEPPPKTTTKVPVVYYLSRNGHLDHPHFMEVALSSTQGLFLRDVLARLNLLRGDAIAHRYSWSSKRSYKNGYVWHDLTAHDLVHPAHANEYVLKGSELLPLLAPPPPRDASAAFSSSSSSGCLQDSKSSTGGRAARGRKNWSSFDLREYRVAVRGSDVHLCAADAATQTDDRRGRRRIPEPTTELGMDEISPPPSSSSPETLETLIKNDARVAAAQTTVAPQCKVAAAGSSRAEGEVGVIAGGRMRASAVLMQLISCGSVTVKDRRGRSDLSLSADGMLGGMERDYFSGSLVETKKTTSCDAHGVGRTGELKRSSSYNADRSVSQLECRT